MKQPYRITIEQYDQKISIEKDRSDIDLEEFFRNALQYI